MSLHSQCQMQKMKKDKIRQEKCRRTYRHTDDRKSLASSAWQGWVGYLEGTGGCLCPGGADRVGNDTGDWKKQV